MMTQSKTTVQLCPECKSPKTITWNHYMKKAANPAASMNFWLGQCEDGHPLDENLLLDR